MFIELQGPVDASMGVFSVNENGLFCNDNDETVWYSSIAEWLYLGIAAETCAVVGVDSYGGIPLLDSVSYPGALGAEFYTAFMVGDYDRVLGSYLDDEQSFLQGVELVDPANNLWWIGDVNSPGVRIFENGWVHCTPQGKVAGFTIRHDVFGGPLPLME